MTAILPIEEVTILYGQGTKTFTVGVGGISLIAESFSGPLPPTIALFKEGIDQPIARFYGPGIVAVYYKEP
jgi:hypothetical protein